MKVIIDTLFDHGSEGMWKEYVVVVTDIPTSGEDDDFIIVKDETGSRLEAEIYAEVFQHYTDTFPGAEGRLFLAAIAPCDVDAPIAEDKDRKTE